jgi:hypothetical protein
MSTIEDKIKTTPMNRVIDSLYFMGFIKFNPRFVWLRDIK